MSLATLPSPSFAAATRERLLQLEFSASVALRDLPRLLAVYREAPGLFREREEASAWVARLLLEQGEMEAWRRLRAGWLGRETRPDWWLPLDADGLMAAGQARQAAALLEGARFSGPAEGARLLRLAMLHLHEPAKAFDCLRQARAADPNNPELRNLRGQILEAGGKIALAQAEYEAAVAAAPHHPLLWDQLAEFHQRHHHHRQAAETRAQGLRHGSLDFMELKAAFWPRLTFAPAGPAPGVRAAPGRLAPLARFIRELPPGRFWDEALYRRQGLADEGDRHPETAWLRLLDDLQNGREKEALARFEAARFPLRLAPPEMIDALRIVLRLRVRGQAPRPEDCTAAVPVAERHQLVGELAAWAAGGLRPPETTLALLESETAWAAVLLAGGWFEAALRLAPACLAAAPEWLVSSLAQAWRLARGAEPALAFLAGQQPTPLLQLAAGELELELGRPEAVRARLAPLAGDDSELGFRAALLLASEALGARDAAAARRWLEGSPRLAASTPGRELRARLALLEGDSAAAARLYATLGGKSVEAQLFLARKAYDEHRWSEARRRAKALLRRFPDSAALRQNLDLILQGDGP